jgi:hypothetical protein
MVHYAFHNVPACKKTTKTEYKSTKYEYKLWFVIFYEGLAIDNIVQ